MGIGKIIYDNGKMTFTSDLGKNGLITDLSHDIDDKFSFWVTLGVIDLALLLQGKEDALPKPEISEYAKWILKTMGFMYPVFVLHPVCGNTDAARSIPTVIMYENHKNRYIV